GMVFAVLLVNALISYLNIRRLRETDRSVRHTYDVISALGELMATVLDAETGQRSVLIAEKKQFLEPYTLADTPVDRRLQELTEMVSDNDQQSANLAELKDLVEERLAAHSLLLPG